MASKNKIPIHKDELKDEGAAVIALHGLKFTDHGLHRDDHYMFILQKSGHFVFELDFKEVELHGASVCYVAPGQVHRYLKVEDTQGWLLFLETHHIPVQFRESLDNILNLTQQTSVENKDAVFTITDILEKYWLDKWECGSFRIPVIKSLMDTIIGIIVSKLLNRSINLNLVNSPKYLLANRFKKYIRERFIEMKQVKQYASLLNLTPLYLNEVMKEITGFSASYWIQQEIILEAKRLLAYTDKDIREIAWQLGYEDYAYFSRFFKKSTGITASAFRTKP